MRQPMAVTNWKMEMTIAQSVVFAHGLQVNIGDLAHLVDVVICPPYTGLYALSEALEGSPIQLGGQNLSTASGGAFTGQISGALLKDVGCRWVLVGHWEVRRHFGDTDETANRKAHRALGAGLRPILLVGEARGQRDRFAESLRAQLSRVLVGIGAAEVAQMAFVYEPEWTIGVTQSAPPEHVAAGCREIRQWLADSYGEPAAQGVRILYGGSVMPEGAEDLLEAADVDGLGATRRGRQVESFSQIIHLIARNRPYDRN
jgi:triosephosphate isomerase